MQQFLYTLAIIFSVYLISFALINIRHIFTGNKFRGTCASANPALEKKIGGCGCGKTDGSACENA